MRWNKRWHNYCERCNESFLQTGWVWRRWSVYHAELLLYRAVRAEQELARITAELEQLTVSSERAHKRRRRHGDDQTGP
eukprot:4346831-Prorocentrum_lima.AAC.1